jgi:hypothetical protein
VGPGGTTGGGRGAGLGGHTITAEKATRAEIKQIY